MLQYYHKLHGTNKYTVAIDVPSKEVFLDLLKIPNTTLSFKLGKARCHTKDQYVRKIGREISSQKLEKITFKLKEVLFEDDHMLFKFKKNETYVQFKIFYVGNKVHFVYYCELNNIRKYLTRETEW